MLISSRQIENQHGISEYIAPAIPPAFLWSATNPSVDLVTGKKCTVRSDNGKSRFTSAATGNIETVAPTTASAPVLTSSVPLGNSKGYALLVVTARDPNMADVTNVIISPDGTLALQWSWNADVIGVAETTYLGGYGASMSSATGNSPRVIVFGKSSSGKFFVSVNGVAATNGYLDGNSANLAFAAGSITIPGVVSGNTYPLVAALGYWNNVPADIISAEYATRPWSCFGYIKDNRQLYQPADSILVPPYLSNPGVSNITTTGAQPVVKVEY